MGNYHVSVDFVGEKPGFQESMKFEMVSSKALAELYNTSKIC